MIALILATTLVVRPTAEPIHVDAKLDEAAWSAATPIPVAFEWYPSDNTPAPVATEALVTYDKHTLYVAFRAHDPQPAKIRARYHERDSGMDDDLVGFYVDPFNDDRLAYQFRVNPLGVQIDAINSDVEASEDFSWDGIWESAGRLTADGYVVEVAIPLQQLRIPSRSGPQTWGFMAVREWPRDVSHRLRSIRTDQNRDCLVCQLADLQGFQTSGGGRNLEVTPTLTGTNDDALDAGVSARWAVTPGTSLQGTINPDFSQVEADAAQLDVNTQFALFYPEKRPFFVQGSDFFETRLPLVFTRTIADPSAGLKLTGKSGRDLYGLLMARDEITNVLIPGDQSSTVTAIDGGSTTALGRYRRELRGSSTVGGLVTSRSGRDYQNLVVAADSYVRLTPSDSLRVQLAGSRTEYPDALAAGLDQPRGAFQGHALEATYDHSDRDWTWGAYYAEVDPKFRADSGFFNQVGIRQTQLFTERRLRGGADRWYRNLYLGFSVDGTRQSDGDWNEWGSDITFTYQGPRQSEIEFGLAPNQENYLGVNYHDFRWSSSFAFQASRDVALQLGVRGGEAIDFNNAQQADFITISPAADLNLGRRFSGALTYDYQVFRTKEGDRIFTVHLPQARLLYHFNPRTFLRTIVQYEMVDRVTSESRDLLTQLLFSYRINAETVFLAGISDIYEGEVDLTRTQRAVFVKLSYAWLF